MLNCWNTVIKLGWFTRMATRVYLVQQVLSVGQTLANVNILSRYRNFFHGLIKYPSYEVRLMANIASRDNKIYH